MRRKRQNISGKSIEGRKRDGRIQVAVGYTYTQCVLHTVMLLEEILVSFEYINHYASRFSFNV